jgi:hypothetical protein
MAADKPGKQPITIPKVVEAMIAKRLMGANAFKRPAPIMPKVSITMLSP